MKFSKIILLCTGIMLFCLGCVLVASAEVSTDNCHWGDCSQPDETLAGGSTGGSPKYRWHADELVTHKGSVCLRAYYQRLHILSPPTDYYAKTALFCHPLSPMAKALLYIEGVRS